MRIIKRWEAYFGMAYSSRAMIKFFSLLVCVSHWTACMWGWIGSNQGTGAFTWIEATFANKAGATPGWTRTPLEKYVLSLHFAIMTLTSVGYGDIVPQTLAEYSLCCVIMAVGAIVWAWIIGNFFAVISQLDMFDAEHKRLCDDIGQMMCYHNIGSELRRSVRAFMQQSKE